MRAIDFLLYEQLKLAASYEISTAPDKPIGIFEGARGLVGVMASGADIGEATKDLGKRWELLQTGLTFCLRSGQSWVYRRRARA